MATSNTMERLISSRTRAHCIAQIEQNAKVALGYSTEGGILSSAIYIAVEGQAQLIRDKAEFKRATGRPIWTGGSKKASTRLIWF